MAFMVLIGPRQKATIISSMISMVLDKLLSGIRVHLIAAQFELVVGSS
jgi:hypothetical protein